MKLKWPVEINIIKDACDLRVGRKYIIIFKYNLLPNTLYLESTLLSVERFYIFCYPDDKEEEIPFLPEEYSKSWGARLIV